MASHRGHSGAASDINHLSLRLFDEEFAIRPADRHFVAGLQVKNIRRRLSRRQAHVSRRRCRDAHIEHHNIIFRRIAGHRIRAEDRLVVVGLKVPNLILFPIRTILFFNIKFFVTQFVLGNVDLYVAAGLKVHRLPGRQLKNKLLNERRNIIVGAHRAIVLLNVEDLLGNLDLHILADLDLAGQADVILLFRAGNQALLRRKNVAAAFCNLALAHRARSAATTRRWKKDLVVRQRHQKGSSSGNNERVLLIINSDLAVVLVNHFRFDQSQKQNQYKNDPDENASA